MLQRRREIFSRSDASSFLVRVKNLMLAYPHCKIIVNIDPGIHISYLTCTVEVRNEARKVAK
jgi:hypothetical protein